MLQRISSTWIALHHHVCRSRRNHLLMSQPTHGRKNPGWLQTQGPPQVRNPRNAREEGITSLLSTPRGALARKGDARPFRTLFRLSPNTGGTRRRRTPGCYANGQYPPPRGPHMLPSHQSKPSVKLRRLMHRRHRSDHRNLPRSVAWGRGSRPSLGSSRTRRSRNSLPISSSNTLCSGMTRPLPLLARLQRVKCPLLKWRPNWASSSTWTVGSEWSCRS